VKEKRPRAKVKGLDNRTNIGGKTKRERAGVLGGGKKSGPQVETIERLKKGMNKLSR